MSSLEAMGERSHDISQGEIKHDPQLRAFLLQLPCSPTAFYLHPVTGWLVLQLLLLLGDPNNIFPFCPTTLSTACPNTAGRQHQFTRARACFLSPALLLASSLTMHQFLPFQAFAGWHWAQEASALASCGWPACSSLPGLGRGQTQHRFPKEAPVGQNPQSYNPAADQVTGWGHGKCQLKACLRKHG